MEKERKKPKPFKVNEDRIYANKFYPYYFTEDLRVNVVPVKFYTRYQAKLTLKGQFGKDWYKYLKIATGRMILSRGWKFGKNSVMIEGKHHQIRRYYIPLEWNYNKRKRKVFRRLMDKTLKIGKRSMINQFLKTYYMQTL